MNKIALLKTALLLTFTATLASTSAGIPRSSTDKPGLEPIRLHPENPHYFLWRGKPAILVTSGEHYGAVLNLDFDYIRYLEVLRAHGFNLTRVFSGVYREVPGSFNIKGNTLAPAVGRFVCPWARSLTSGASDGGNKFDLNRWDEAYFRRLRDFVGQASERGVVVELVLFCTMYDDAVWEASPMNGRNNINAAGNIGKYDVYNAKDQRLFEYQKALTRKLGSELNGFDNVYFEVCNEPYERGGLTREWNDSIVSTLADTEVSLPRKHLVAQGFPRSATAITELNARVSVLNFHAEEPDAVRLNYHHNRVVAFDESGGSDQSDRKYRSEAWKWLLAGGAVYDHLDFSFTTERPDGTAVPLPEGTPGGGGPELRRQLQVVKEFVEGFNFIRMIPANEIVKELRGNSAGAAKATFRALGERGQAYAIYVAGGTVTELMLELPEGRYKAEWINTKTGLTEKTEVFSHAPGAKILQSMNYAEDVALRVRRESSPK